MVLPVQFQLGLELTNIVNPISQAVSAVGSLALIDAIRKSGSDTITEMKLASFIGRHIIDPAMKLHFQEAVSKSDQSVISRYMDIILESGSGPTVQEAIKNPALFSMVIQLSGLAFAHEQEPLAGAIVEAMERIVRQSGADVAIVPDYVALLGTLRACQEQTAGFRWASVYEAVEHKIQQTLAHEWSRTDRSAKRRKLDPSPNLSLPGVGARRLPFPVLQALLMWLHSLQKFPEHRLLHLRCDSGVSTIVVWCYHVLGLSVEVDLSGTSIFFGKEPRNILIQETGLKDVGASLMDPAEQHEPLFTLVSAIDDPAIGYENRAEAYGFGRLVLKAAGLSEGEEQYCSQWIIAHCMEPKYVKGFYNKYPCEDSMIHAGKFLFGLETVDVEALRKHTGSSFRRTGNLSRIVWPRLAAILVTFARIQKQDLERCNSMPLSLSAYHSPRHEFRGDQLAPDNFVKLSFVFEYLANLLLGHMYSAEYVANAVLISAWGWSIFFDIFNAEDPSETSNTIRVMIGAPSRRGVRRARIIDGPTDMDFVGEVVYESPPTIMFAPGLSTGKRGNIMVGHNSDAFQITQIFTWTPDPKAEQKMQKFGFRKMQDLCDRTKQFSSCECAPISSDIAKQLDAYREKGRFRNEFSFYSVPLQPSWLYQYPSLEKVIACETLDEGHGVVPLGYFFYVSDNAAARWLGLQLICAQSQIDPHPMIMRGFDTCLDCATAFPRFSLGYSKVLL